LEVVIAKSFRLRGDLVKSRMSRVPELVF